MKPNLKKIIFLICFIASMPCAATEFDTSSTYQDLKTLNEKRIQSLNQAKTSFLSAKDQIEQAGRLDKQADEYNKRATDAQISWIQKGEVKDKEYQSQHQSITTSIVKLATDGKKEYHRLKDLRNKYHGLIAVLKEANSRKKTPTNILRINELKSKIETAKNEIARLEQWLKTNITDIEKNKVLLVKLESDHEKWVSQWVQDGANKIAPLLRELKVSDQKVGESLNQFTDSYFDGLYKLSDYKVDTAFIESIATKFLSGVKGLGELLCFIEGTVVATPEGPRAIETIEEGDEVHACSQDLTECSIQQVKKVIFGETAFFIVLGIGGENILTTPNHPIYTKNEGWKKAKNIRLGDEVVGMEEGEFGAKILKSLFVEKKSFRRFAKPVKIYNLEVEQDHTYFAGPKRILVHNCNIKNDFDNIKALEPVGEALKSGAMVTLNLCRFSAGLNSVALVGGPTSGVVNLGVVVASCGAVIAMCTAAIVNATEFGSNLHVMQSKIRLSKEKEECKPQCESQQAPEGLKTPEDSAIDKWSREPKSLQDQMALEAAKKGEGRRLSISLNDLKYKGMDKMEYKIKSDSGKDTVIHYVRNPNTGELMDFKFKKHSTD